MAYLKSFDKILDRKIMVQEYVDENLQNFFSQFKGKPGCQKQLKERQKENVAIAEIFSWIQSSKT